MKYNEKTTLAKALGAKNGQEILAKYRVPCLGCHFASQELDDLTLKDINDAYGIDLKSILQELNDTKTSKTKVITKKVVKKTKAKKGKK